MKTRNLAANMFSILIVIGLVILGVLGVARDRIAAPGPSAEAIYLQVPQNAKFADVSDESGGQGRDPAGIPVPAGGAVFRQGPGAEIRRVRDPAAGVDAGDPGTAVDRRQRPAFRDDPGGDDGGHGGRPA